MMGTRSDARGFVGRRRWGARRGGVMFAAGLGCGLVAVAPGRAGAAEAVWDGGPGSWASLRWGTGSFVTDSQTDVRVDGGKALVASAVTLNTLADTRDLTIDADDAVIGTGAISAYGNVTVNGAIDLRDTGGRTTVGGDLVFAGPGAAVLGGSGTIILGGDVSRGMVSQKPGGTVIESGIQIRGAKAEIRGVNSTFVNRGTITANAAGGRLELTGISNEGTLESTGGGAIYLSGVENSGVIRVGQNSRGLVLNPLTNRGTIEVAAGGDLELRGVSNVGGAEISVTGGRATITQGTWRNDGTVRLHDGVLGIGINCRTGDLGNVVRSGASMIVVSGALDNTGGTIGGTGPSDRWRLQLGGLTGGVVTTSGGAEFSVMNGRLDGVTVNGSIVLVPYDINSTFSWYGNKDATIKNGLTLNGGKVEVAADLGRAATLTFTGENAQTLGGDAEIVLGAAGENGLTIRRELRANPDPFGPPIYVPAGDVTFGPAVLIHGASGSVGVGAEGRFVNRGTIAADVAGGSLKIDNLTNQGVIRVGAGSSISFGEGVVPASGEVRVDGTLTKATSALEVGGVVSGEGTVAAALRVTGAVSPGAGDGGVELGTLTVTGDVAFAPGGDLRVQVGASGADVLKIVGSLDLGAIGDVLEVSPVGGASPGAAFLVATYTGERVGTFDDVTAGFVASYDTPHEVWVTAVPEPGGWAAGVVGVGVASTMARRRRGR